MSKTGDWAIKTMNQEEEDGPATMNRMSVEFNRRQKNREVEEDRPLTYWKEVAIGLAIFPLLWALMSLLMLF